MKKFWQGRGLWFLITIPPLFFGLMSLLLGQDNNWDLRNYHWYNGYAALTGRGVQDLLPSQTPWFYNPALDIPVYWTGVTFGPKILAFVLGAIQGLNFPLLYLLAESVLPIRDVWRRHLASFMLAALGMYGGGGVALIGTCFYDNVTSLGLFTSALMTVRWADRWPTPDWRRAARLAFFCGLPAGLMMGLKLPSAVFCVGLCLGFLALGGGIIRSLALCFFFGLGALTGLAASLGWWAIHLQENFGSPLFPYFNQIFQSPLAPPVSARDTQFIPHSATALLLAPFRFAANPMLVGEIPWRDWRLPIWYAVFLLSVGFWWIRLMHRDIQENLQAEMLRDRAGRYLLITFVVSYVLWLLGFSVYRYLIPMEMIAPLLIAVMISGWPVAAIRRAWLCIVLGLVIAVSVIPGDWGRRVGWLDHVVEAKLPPLGDTNHLMVLMAGYEPYAHLVTAFPAHIPFVRIESNFANPREDKGINRVVAERIAKHLLSGGRFALLIPPWQHKMADEALATHHLTLSKKPCLIVVDRLYNDNQMDFCDVVPVRN